MTVNNIAPETAGSLGLCGVIDGAAPARTPDRCNLPPGPMRVLHPAVSEKTRWFNADHLPADLATVSLLFRDLVYRLLELNLAGPQLAIGMQKLIEAKDATVRAAIAARDDEA